MRPPRRGAWRFVRRAGVVLGAVTVALVALFLIGVPVPGDYLREPLERLLTATFGVPVRVEGPVRLRTGTTARAEAGALVLVDPGRAGTALARAARPAVRIDLIALLRDVVRIEEITADTLDVELAQSPDGRGNWAPLLEPKGSGGGGAKIAFAGIEALRIAKVDVGYRGADAGEAAHWTVNDFAGSIAADRPVSVRGRVRLADHLLEFEARSASLAALARGDRPIPIDAVFRSLAVRLTVKGDYSVPAGVLDLVYEFSAPDSGVVLRSAGVDSRNAGPVDSRGRVRVTAVAATVRDLDVRLGESRLTGAWAMEWGGARPRLSADLKASLLDARPFDKAAPAASTTTALEAFVAGLDQVTAALDLDVKAEVAELRMSGPDLHQLRVEARTADRVLSASARVAVWGLHANARLGYDARKPKKTLTGRIDGGRVSTADIPKEQLTGGIAATIGDLRGQFQGQGANAHDIAASLRGALDARDVHVKWLQGAGEPRSARLASARFEFGGGKPVHAQIRGRVAGQACAVRGSGGTLDAFLAGHRWPVQLEASCPGVRLAAKGRVTHEGRRWSADGTFDGQAGNLASVLAMAGLRSKASLPVAMRGALETDGKLASVKLDHAAIGRTVGSGQVRWQLAGKAPRQQLSLSLKSADFDELAEIAASPGAIKATDAMSREVLPANLPFPDWDIELAADAARASGETLRRLRLAAHPQDGRLPPARFGFDWSGGSVAGEVSADLRGARPTVELKLTAQRVDLDAVLARAGYRDAGLRAEEVTLRGNASGTRLGDLLASAAAEAALAGGRIRNVERFLPGHSGDGTFTANFVVAPDGPAKLAARGKAADSSIEIDLAAAKLTALAHPGGGVPFSGQAIVGETRLQGTGKLAPDGTGEVRASLSGSRLDRLGRLVGARLPEVGPFSAAVAAVIAADTVRATEVDLRLGKSRLQGEILMRRGNRFVFEAALRSPALYLEDLGLEKIAGAGNASASAGGARQDAAEPAIAGLQRTLRGFDGKGTLDIEALHAAGVRYANVRLGATLAGGDLRISARDMQLRGGSARADVRLEAGRPRPRLRMNVLTEGFDYGPVAKALVPKSTLAGTLDLSFDLVTEALAPPYFADAQGRVEAALYPRDLHLGAADYWGTSLLHFVQRTLDPATESRLNCAVVILNVKEGIARTEGFFADTTRVRVIGEVQMEIASRRLSGQLSPRAKNPQVFSVAPTVMLSGTLEKPEVTMAPQSLITAPLRLVLPIHSYALDWLTQSGGPKDGVSGCRQAFEQARKAAVKPPVAPEKPETVSP